MTACRTSECATNPSRSGSCVSDILLQDMIRTVRAQQLLRVIIIYDRNLLMLCYILNSEAVSLLRADDESGSWDGEEVREREATATAQAGCESESGSGDGEEGKGGEDRGDRSSSFRHHGVADVVVPSCAVLPDASCHRYRAL